MIWFQKIRVDLARKIVPPSVDDDEPFPAVWPKRLKNVVSRWKTRALSPLALRRHSTAHA